MTVVLAVAQEAAVNAVTVSTLEAGFRAQQRVACRGRVGTEERSTTTTQTPQRSFKGFSVGVLMAFMLQQSVKQGQPLSYTDKDIVTKT